MADEKKQSVSGNKKGLIIALVIILLSINGVSLFFNYTQRQELESKEQAIVEKNQEIINTISDLESVKRQLEESRSRIAELGGNVDELNAIILELENDKDKLRKDASAAQRIMRQYKERAEGYKELLEASEEKIAELTAQRDALFEQKQGLELKVIAKEDSIRNLAMSKEELAKKVAEASVLEAENINIEAITPKDKLKDGSEIKAKHIHILRVKFRLGENRVAKHEAKDVMMRLIAPDGSCLFDLNTGGGTFMHEGKEKFYTDKKSILFANQNEKVNFDYIKGSPWKPGKHKIELFADGFKIGESEFIVK
ncbi:chromosome segregation protein SMC [Cytophagaceae bacterium ABcell3]|nr:chromosome segregation protein SMC [Cytophagaceae bacterium ABcell3]